MEITKEFLNLEKGLSREWLITNGIGGYASSTVIGANTRRYHGLLVAPLNAPAKRHVILSKVDEAIVIDGKKYDLYTNVGTEYTSQGYKYLEKFEKEYVPIFRYNVKDIEITKIICFDHGKNTIGIYYKVKTANKPCKMTLAPVMNFRDFHWMSTGHEFNLVQTLKSGKVRIVIDDNRGESIYMKLSEGEYTPHYNDTFRNMFYIEEQKRGFYPEENHVVPGVYEIEIEENTEKEFSFVCSLEENIDEIDVKDLISKEIIRQNEIYNKSLLIDNRNNNKTKKEKEEEQFIKDLISATDNFVLYRPTFALHSIIAGFPWFLDWGRDSAIAFEGLLLVTRRFEIAKEVLLTMIRDVKYGLVPNGYSGFDNRPLYNSADSSLLLFETVQKYLDYTGDLEFIEENIYPVMKQVIIRYIEGIDFDDNNIYMDIDNLIVSGTENTQNTWMDAKFEGFAVTPRNGKAVEINALWYNANKIMQELSLKLGEKEESKKYEDIANDCKKSFVEKFYNKKRKCLFDVVGDKKIRPNQLFALSLTYPVVDPQSEMAKDIINTVEKKLLNNYGLKTLAKGEENYVEVYEGGPEQRDKSYHQGITWPWLLGLYYNSLKNMLEYTKAKKQKQEIENKIEKLREQVIKTFKVEFYENGCIESISELYDSAKPQLPKGAFAQAWSVSEIFRIVLGK